jgi:DNA-directed RNA polymerase alpha subunit
MIISRERISPRFQPSNATVKAVLKLLNDTNLSPEAKVEAFIECLNISVQATNRLIGASYLYNTVQELVNESEANLLRIPAMGRTQVAQVLNTFAYLKERIDFGTGERKIPQTQKEIIAEVLDAAKASLRVRRIRNPEKKLLEALRRDIS